jgi:hypothetical protein
MFEDAILGSDFLHSFNQDAILDCECLHSLIPAKFQSSIFSNFYQNVAEITNTTDMDHVPEIQEKILHMHLLLLKTADLKPGYR